MTHRALAQEGPISVERISRYPLSSAPKTPTQGACSITIERGRRLALGAALSLAGFAPSTTGRFSGVHRGTGLLHGEGQQACRPCHRSDLDAHQRCEIDE